MLYMLAAGAGALIGVVFGVVLGIRIVTKIDGNARTNLWDAGYALGLAAARGAHAETPEQVALPPYHKLKPRTQTALPQTVATRRANYSGRPSEEELTAV